MQTDLATLKEIINLSLDPHKHVSCQTWPWGRLYPKLQRLAAYSIHCILSGEYLPAIKKQADSTHVNKWHASQSEFLVPNALMIWLNNTYPFWGKRIHFPIPTQNETSNLCQKSSGAILKNPVGTCSRSLKPNPNFRSSYHTLIFAAEKVEIQQASTRVKPVEWCKLWS